MNEGQIKKGLYNCPNCGAAATPESVRCAYCHSSLATVVCSKCFGAIFIGMKHCPWCGESAAAGKPAEAAKGKCPRCNMDFLLVRISKRTLSECPACGGLWVDHDTLQEICASQEEQQAVLGFNPQPSAASPSEQAKPTRVYIPCPRCNKLMQRRQFAGCSRVVVDWCKTHGTWFDRNELHQIVQFILDGGLGKSREREKHELEQARQRLLDEKRNMQILSHLGSDADLGSSKEILELDLCDIFGGIWRSLKKNP